MRDVLHELTGRTGDELNYDAEIWYKRLVVRPSPGLPATPLRPGKSGGQYRARAYIASGFGPAWNRIKELERVVGSQRAAASPSQITINIHGNTIAALNLGTVVGNIEASIATLQQGDPDVARALKELVEAILADETLGDQRRDVVESLNQVAEEAKKPPGSRSIGLVKILLIGVGYVLIHSANLAQIWQTWSKPITRFFGLPDQ